MRYFSWFLIVCSLSGCATSHHSVAPAFAADSLAPHPTLVLPAAPAGRPATAAGPHRPGLLRRLFPPAPRRADTVRLSYGGHLVLPRKMRHSQLTVVIGNQNKVSQTQDNKFKAPTAIGSDSAVVTDQRGVTNAVAGKGNTATQTATTKQAADWKARLTGPLGWVLAAGVVGGGLYLLGPWLLALFTRRRSA